MQRSDVIQLKANMTLRLIEHGDHIVDERRHHNVFLASGRQWLTYLIGARAYPGLGSIADVTDVDMGDSATYALGTDYAGTVPTVYQTPRIRWIGLGTGGTLQTYTPPGPGGYIEVPTVRGLENPVTVSPNTSFAGPDFWWMGQVDAQDTSNVVLDFPDVGTIVFRRLFLEDEISFSSALGTSQDYQGNIYGTEVPISEAALFTSQAYPLYPPHKDYSLYSGQTVPGIICYGINSPLVKTPKVALETIWEISVA